MIKHIAELTEESSGEFLLKLRLNCNGSISTLVHLFFTGKPQIAAEKSILAPVLIGNNNFLFWVDEYRDLTIKKEEENDS